MLKTSKSATPQSTAPAERQAGQTGWLYQREDKMFTGTYSQMFLRSMAVAAWVLPLLAPPAAAQKPGGTATLGMELDIPGFDPLKVGVYDTAARSAAALMFDTLTRLDDEGKPQPKLARSWSASEDLKDWTFELQPGVKFSDGTPFNAQAVKFNYDRMRDPNNHCNCAFYLSNIAQVDAPDELTVIFRLRNPLVNVPALLAASVVTTAYHSPTAAERLGADYNRNPVGTGPFVLKSWVAGDRLVLERNPNYWRPGFPRLDKVILRPLPDAQARFASLQAGESDVIWDDNFDNIDKAENDKSLVVYKYTGSGASVAAFNTKVAPFDDVGVRRALVMAIDREKMSQAISNGRLRPAQDPYGAGSFVKCQDVGALPYDPAKAKELLQEHGRPVSFKLVVTATPRGRLGGQIFQQFWKQIGADVELDQVDQTTLITKAFKHDFQLTPWRIIDSVDPASQMYASFHTGSPVNLAQYSNAELDALLERARATVDQSARIKDYCEIARIINRDAPWFWMFQNTYYAIAKAKLKGVPKLYSDVIDISESWLDE
jgi:4-phytase/acid phosphatase/peptide/nickel transport system substrate-binding protein